ncbi:alpha-aminoadipic semialdehyde synthase, mitochondrial [Lingula anatina]|uniref:Alpha-aminoadipic semialdehyde synthase, mitochondrial n=1 Tax=Lingula anatina TaxID=7574 RepID=A0A1S3IH63_LINAN|nr:alpha-aminoadipic semialdehyde synthase, mitochondrial [Lingula anatina]|eukprot:XP_013397211.2 alpha-aminoadipic semialdehyde synthase, mitochondrial [Lingula anatina]
MPSNKAILGISREYYNPWERRAALSPDHVASLVKEGVQVLVQPSKRRGYTEKEYQEAGAEIREDLSDATLITSIKQIPEEYLIPNKTYSFFSHTIKAQEHNMPLLDAILEKNIRIVDYEKLVDGPGEWPAKAMSRYAGIVGMVDVLSGLGLRLLALGFNTPLLHISQAYNYPSYEDAKKRLAQVGREIAESDMFVGPLTFIFTATGDVSKGAQEMFKLFPHEYVEPDRLQEVAKKGSKNKFYATVVSRRHRLRRIQDGGYDEAEFTAHPERYRDVFATKFAPYASVIVNGTYWEPGQPRLISDSDAMTLLARNPNAPTNLTDVGGNPVLPRRLLAISDISADEDGSIQWTKECTQQDTPYYIYDKHGKTTHNGMTADGVLMCSVDNMPAQFPRDATDYFGDLYLPFVRELLRTDATSSFEDFTEQVCPALVNSVIATNGRLAPSYEYIKALRKKMEEEKRKKTRREHYIGNWNGHV